MTELVALARRLLRRGGSHESVTSEMELTDHELSAALQARLSEGAPAVPRLEAAQAAELAREMVANASSLLRRSSEGAEESGLSEAESSSLEAIVMLSGRPALRYSDGKLEPLNKLRSNEEWRLLVSICHKTIEERSESVGRIARVAPDRTAVTIGTGWRLGDNLVVTNRHVAEELAADAAAPPATWKMDCRHTTVVDFAAVDNATAERVFVLKSIAWCADRGDPDLAILAFTVPPGREPPPALPLEWNGDLLGRTIIRSGQPVFQGRQVYVVGHPWWPRQSSAVTRVFGRADGMKRWSPGYVTEVRSATGTFRTDCSTLGGYSGSCVLSAETHRVVGVHFAGVNTDDETGRGVANAALSLESLRGSAAEKILAQGRV